MNDINDILEAALRYAELGYPVFPCAPRGKKPATANGFKNATTDPHIIRQWWAQQPSANIAIPTDGLLVIDVDVADSAWPDDPERAAQLATAGALATTPRGGRHYWYRRPHGKSWRCTQSRLAQKVDTRTDGGYILVAPSVTTHGAYAWLAGLELEQAPTRLPLPPDWLMAQLDTLGKDARSAPGNVNGSSEVIPEGRRNATLAKLAGAMRRAGFSQAEIAAALTIANCDRCAPPLDQKEVETIAASIARYQPHSTASAFVMDEVNVESTERFDQEFVDGDPGPLPQSLLQVPGFIGDVMRYTLASAPYPAPVLAFAGALALQSFLTGRKVRDDMDNRTNVYVVALANSGVGKDHARKINARISIAAGLGAGLGTSFASGEGIEDRLFVQPTTLFQVDEFDGLLLRVGQARDGRHEQIVSMLLQMYSRANDVHILRAKADREHTQIHQPWLGLFGTAVPQQFYESISARFMTNGLLARLLVFDCGKRGSGQDAVSLAMPESITATARWWAEHQPGDKWDEKWPTPRLVPHDAGAGAVFADLRQRADAEYDRAEKAKDLAGTAMWARVHEKARRLALSYACSAHPVEPVIDRSCAEWAGAIALHQTRRMLFLSRQYSSESDFDSKRKRLLQVLAVWREEHGDAWMPSWKLNRKLPWPSHEHEVIRQTLLEQRLIDVKSPNAGKVGRSGISYRLAVPPQETRVGP